jgi:hypothetical protein
MSTSNREQSSAATTDAERVKLEKSLHRHPDDGFLSWQAAQENPVKDSPPPPSTETVPSPPLSSWVVLKRWLLASTWGQSPAKIPLIISDLGRTGLIRDEPSKPLVDAELAGRFGDSRESTRGMGLRLVGRIRNEPVRENLTPDRLNETMTDILTAAMELDAFGLTSARPLRAIAERAGGFSHGARNVREAVEVLRTEGLLAAKRGNKGGTWITKRGIEFLEAAESVRAGRRSP